MDIRNAFSARPLAAAARLWRRWFASPSKTRNLAAAPPVSLPGGDALPAAALDEAPLAAGGSGIPETPACPADASQLPAPAPAAAPDQPGLPAMAAAGALAARPDLEMEALGRQAQGLERQIVDLSARQAEMQQRLQRFEFAQYQALGDLLAENLRLRQEWLGLQARRSGRPEDQEAEREAAAEFEAYRRGREAGEQELPCLDQGQQAELKRIYRAAAMRCHPDRVGHEDKERAHALFLRTQAAYQQNDLDGLRLIHRQLAGDAGVADAAPAPGREAMLAAISRLQDQVADLILAIQTLQLDRTYRQAVRTEEWDEHFASVRAVLEGECRSLRHRIRSFAAT